MRGEAHQIRRRESSVLEPYTKRFSASHTNELLDISETAVESEFLLIVYVPYHTSDHTSGTPPSWYV